MPQKNKAYDRKHPKSLTARQRRFVDALVERFGDRYTSVKRAELKKAAIAILGTQAAPGWVTRNTSVRIAGKRGMYDLSHLLTLPVIESPSKKKTTATG